MAETQLLMMLATARIRKDEEAPPNEGSNKTGRHPLTRELDKVTPPNGRIMTRLVGWLLVGWLVVGGLLVGWSAGCVLDSCKLGTMDHSDM